MIKKQNIIDKPTLLWVLICFLILTSPLVIRAQQAGEGAFRFLNLTSSTRLSALSVPVVSLPDADVADINANPAYIDSSLHRTFNFNYTNLFADAGLASVSGIWHDSSLGTFAASIRFLEYGHFDRTDETGQQLGSFSVYDFAAGIGYGISYREWSFGSMINGLYSSIHSYTSAAFTVDAGIHYSLNERQNVGLAFRNLGAQFSSYNGQREPISPSLNIGYSHELLYLPLRLTVTAQQLTNWGLMTSAEDTDPDFSTDLMRHLGFSGEFLFTDSFHFRFGYNNYKNDMISSESKLNFAGTSFGVGINTSYANIDLSRSSNGDLGPVLAISITTDL